jgi:type I restriction enzyme R subunit
MKTDTTEQGLEALIVAQMIGRPVAPSQPVGFGEDPEPFAGLRTWLHGDPNDYDRGWAVDLVQLRAFVAATQLPLVEPLDLDGDTPARRKFLARLQGEIAKRGVIDILRHGLKHGPHEIALFYPSPSPGNPKAAERFAQNRFSVTRQLRYSETNANALDLALFVNVCRSRHSS